MCSPIPLSGWLGAGPEQRQGSCITLPFRSCKPDHAQATSVLVNHCSPRLLVVCCSLSATLSLEAGPEKLVLDVLLEADHVGFCTIVPCRACSKVSQNMQRPHFFLQIILKRLSPAACIPS